VESGFDISFPSNDQVVAIGTLVAAIGTLIAAFIAAIGLFQTRTAINLQTKSVDVGTALTIFSAIRQSERDLQEIRTNPSQTQFRLVEHFNFLELLAQLHNSKSLTKQTADVCEDALLNHLAVLELNDTARESLERGVTSSEAFKDLGIFYCKHRNALTRRREEISGSLGRVS
jgi:hypothetical protein